MSLHETTQAGHADPTRRHPPEAGESPPASSTVTPTVPPPASAEGRGGTPVLASPSQAPAHPVPMPRQPQRMLYRHADMGLGTDALDRDCFEQLAGTAEHEDWSGRGTTAHSPTWTLREYVEWTFERLYRQRRVPNSPDGTYNVFNTGLLTARQESVYCLFTPNRDPDGPPWQLKGWFPESERGLHECFPELPRIATYTDDPTDFVYDWRRGLGANPQQLLGSPTNLGTLPAPLRDNPYQATLVLESAIRHAVARVRRSYRAAIPCWYPEAERIDLLFPLALTTPETVDAALQICRDGEGYRAHTVLGLDVAYARARQLARPEDWLNAV